MGVNFILDLVGYDIFIYVYFSASLSGCNTHVKSSDDKVVRIYFAFIIQMKFIDSQIFFHLVSKKFSLLGKVILRRIKERC